jgi:iron complex outermembrane receptor protein
LARSRRIGPCLASLLAVLGVAGPASGQASGSDASNFAEEEIIVRASRIESTLLETPAAVSVIGEEEIQLARPQLTLGESLARVPGVFTQNRQNFAQDLRISIRGFGARARFGLRGVKLIVDGIPATLPDGQGQLDTLQLSTAGRIEVIRGPSASLYGSASGGVIRVESEAIGQGVFAAGRVGFGSNGYRSYDAKATVRSGSLGILAGISHQQLAGYREHSAMESKILSTRLEWQIDDTSELMALLSVAQSPLADDPGGLTSLQVVQDRRQASARNEAVDAGERLDQVTTGLRYRRRSGERHETTVAAWYGHRDFRNRLPIRLPEGVTGTLDRSFAGASLQHEYSGDLFGHANSLLMGFDVEVQRDDRMRDHAGQRILDQAEDVSSVRGFIRDELELPQDMALTFSLGFDDLRYRLDDHLQGAGAASDRADFSEWSPAFSLRWNPRQALNPYLRISTSFEPPTTTEFRNPASAGGGLNHDLGAQRAVNYEVGVKGLFPGRLRYGVAVYYIDTSDELIPYENAQFETFYRNAGQTERAGLEVMLEAQLSAGFQLTTAYTFSRAEFTDYVIDGGANLAGNLVPGVPENTFYVELLYMHPRGFFVSLEGRGVGSFYANDANTERTEAYGALDFRMGWKGNWGGWQLTPYIAVSNLTETVYDDNVRLNAFGGRYYEPAAGVQVQGGLGVAYRFE